MNGNYLYVLLALCMLSEETGAHMAFLTRYAVCLATTVTHASHLGVRL